MTRRNSYRIAINPYARANRGGEPEEEGAIAEALGAYSNRPDCPMCLGTGHVTRSLDDNLTEQHREKAEAIAGSSAYPTRQRLVAATLLISGSTKEAARRLGVSRQRILQILNG
jgi:hypothetical protein